MAKVNMSKFNAAMDRTFKELQSAGNMRDFAEYAVDRIVKRTRTGKGVKDRGNDTYTFDPLSEPYKAQRKRDKRKGNLSQFTSPSKSNVTRTNQMLESIRVARATEGKAIIAPYGNRKDGKTNMEVAGYVSENRPFLNLSKAELNGLNRFIVSKIEAILKKFGF